MTFSFMDVVAALAVSSLRFENLSAEPLKKVVKFFRSDAGKALAAELVPATGQQPREPRVLLVTENGVALDTTPAALMKKEGTAAVYCLDAQHLVSELWLSSTEAFLRLDFQEPGPSGRVPRKRGQAARKRASVQRPRETEKTGRKKEKSR
jgi:hypothetical protein